MIDIETKDPLVLERRYAALSGFSDITNERNPPFGDAARAALYATDSNNERGALPKWAREWSAAGPLIGLHGLVVDADDLGLGYAVEVHWRSERKGKLMVIGEVVTDFPSKDLALMSAIVQAAIARLDDQRIAELDQVVLSEID